MKTIDMHDIERLRGLLNMPRSESVSSLPFCVGDTTAGVENELQTVVTGKKDSVDLPLMIENSNYFKNMAKRTMAGETPKSAMESLKSWLENNPDETWENSWVRIPRKALNERAERVFALDLPADKKNPAGPVRSDMENFLHSDKDRSFLRIPVSYLLKLALADVIGEMPRNLSEIVRIGESLLDHFLNDNTSPETFSFFPAPLSPDTGMGAAVAKETLKRFLLTQLLVMYANRKFELVETGQKTVVYFSPHPHTRQKQLNELIPDSFYRRLFMSPCLSGWDQGEEKHRYMNLCHEVLSRSHLNTIPKLKEAGIINRNLVVLPNLSNISLANNGTHVSLGSRKLTALLKDPTSGLKACDEKFMGDLVIKIMEHFLPLFPGIYSAAPYRIDYWDFHPEKVLGFLPHELDFTHLRMIWRRWKKKAGLKIFGRPVTPFGPRWLDRQISRFFGLKGDYVPDYRLIDYFMCLMSTEESPSLDGRQGNGDRLKKDLSEFGIFHTKMPLYLLYRIRECAEMGFSGFEGRHYSLFHSITLDMSQAVTLQNLINALAFKYILDGGVSHGEIPDTSRTESERRQIFFGAAIGIPTFYIRKDTKNLFMARIIKQTEKTRSSRRYPGYIRVYVKEYRKALVRILRKEAADLVEMMGAEPVLEELSARIDSPEVFSAAGKLTSGIMKTGGIDSPSDLSGNRYNLLAETYYREVLRKHHLDEAFSEMTRSFSESARKDFQYQENGLIQEIMGGASVDDFLKTIRKDVINDTLPIREIHKLIGLLLWSICEDKTAASYEKEIHEQRLASVY